MKRIPIYYLFIFLFFCCSCSEDMPDACIIPESTITETFFLPTSVIAFMDVYEDPFRMRTTAAVSDLVSQIRYIIYNESGDRVQEEVLTETEIESGFRVTLPAGEYRMCVLGEGRVVNYTPVGYPPVEVQAEPALGDIWVAAEQRSRAAVYHDYFFAGLSFTAGSPGVKSVVLRRITGLVQVDMKKVAPDIVLHTISIGFSVNRMYNNFHTDGRYSCSGQFTESTSPYAIFHTLRHNPETGYYEGVYFPTLPDNFDCTLIISYRQNGRVRNRRILLSDLPVKANQRTRLSLVLE